jgi:hypothetical protein
MREEWGHPQLQGFADRIPGAFEAAARMPGFICQVDYPEAGPAWPRFKDPARDNGAQTLSLWTDLAAVAAFAYGGLHAEALRHRKEWFVKPPWPIYAAWWVEDDHVPTWEEAVQRLEFLHKHGPTPHAFTFKTPFDAQGHPAHIGAASPTDEHAAPVT